MDNEEKPSWTITLDARERQELEFATIYTEQFQHGTPGHLSYMLIAKLARMLTTMEREGVEGLFKGA